MGMDFWGQVWKRVWKMVFFGLKLGLDLDMRAAHPKQIPRHTPPGPTGSNSEHRRECQSEYQVVVQENIELLFL